VLETEGDIWRQLAQVESEAFLATNASTKRQLELHKKRLRQNLGQRSRSMYELPDYRNIVLEILRFPGLRHQFRAQGLEIFLRGRTIEVFPHLFYIHPYFHELRVRSSIQVLQWSCVHAAPLSHIISIRIMANNLCV
jgi:hypothetical protein